MALQISDVNQYTILVKGETRPYKEQFKQYKGRWDPTLQGWRFSMDKKFEITALINNINANISTGASSTSATVSSSQNPNKINVKNPKVGDIVTVLLNEYNFQTKVSNVSTDGTIIELEIPNSTNKLTATVILGKWRIYDPNTINEIVL